MVSMLELTPEEVLYLVQVFDLQDFNPILFI